MATYIIDPVAITDILSKSYREGIYEGDAGLLGSTFYDKTLLFGDVKGQPYF
ncbi:MAG: hypothetical protein ABI416_14650 [Ginsengibacter sp.]